MKNKELERKRTISISVLLVSFVLYYVITDPDLGLISELPFGVELVFMLQTFIVASVGIVLIETFPDMFTEEHISNQQQLNDLAKSTPQSSAMVLIAVSIRILAYAIIVAATILAMMK